ncbi:hypothetical protein J2Z63_000128 [Mycoplasma yeatsii]|uniref:Uncharacterized protein n=1 Tax=Mycoplasma yeatsii TaxID=51365 RepID=A0ABU0NEG5_9MOLU|nr:hypothetical protein [Mycoplasma yeatsii]
MEDKRLGPITLQKNKNIYNKQLEFALNQEKNQ